MKTAIFLSDEDLISKAARILVEQLGEAEASRFFSIPHNQREESVKRHKLWQKNLDKDVFFDSVFPS